MKAISFYLALPFLYLLALLPMWCLYRVSYFLYLVLFYLVGYRKKVILENMHRSFPDWDDKRLNAGVKTYYRYLCDLLLETFKLLVFSPAKLVKHCHFDEETLDLIRQQLALNPRMTIILGHYGNWEWACNAIRQQSETRHLVVYRPLKNKYFERLTNRMRSFTGSEMVAMAGIFRILMQYREDTYILSLAGDQTPPPENAYWTTFLNQDTPFFNGVEKLSRKFDTSVIYLRVEKIKQGYYVMKGTLICSKAALVKGENEITETFARMLEADITREPFTWLWSHRRWKHKRNQ